jgi:hypothetical protein
VGTAEEDDILVKLVDSKAMQVRVYVGFLGGFSVFFGFFFQPSEDLSTTTTMWVSGEKIQSRRARLAFLLFFFDKSNVKEFFFLSLRSDAAVQGVQPQP